MRRQNAAERIEYQDRNGRWFLSRVVREGSQIHLSHHLMYMDAEPFSCLAKSVLGRGNSGKNS